MGAHRKGVAHLMVTKTQKEERKRDQYLNTELDTVLAIN
jgi:hypothetical protein